MLLLLKHIRLLFLYCGYLLGELSLQFAAYIALALEADTWNIWFLIRSLLSLDRHLKVQCVYVFLKGDHVISHGVHETAGTLFNVDCISPRAGHSIRNAVRHRKQGDSLLVVISLKGASCLIKDAHLALFRGGRRSVRRFDTLLGVALRD